MLKVYGGIYIFGAESSMKLLETKKIIENGFIEQLGTKRKTPIVDLWCYSSQKREFRFDLLDTDIQTFLNEHRNLVYLKNNPDSGIQHAIFSLSPFSQDFENTFSCLLSLKTLTTLCSYGLEFEISPTY